MFNIGQNVLYGANGVCCITDITNKNIAGNDIEYYVLKPIYSDSSTYFLPTHSSGGQSKIREVISENELNEIISHLPEIDGWIEDKNERCELFKNIILHADCAQLIRLIRAILDHEKVQQSKGKHLHIVDEKFLKEAEKMVFDEISIVLHIQRENVLELITNGN